MHTLNLEQLKATTLAGGVTGITLRGDGAAFVVSVQTLRDEAILVTSRKQQIGRASCRERVSSPV